MAERCAPLPRPKLNASRAHTPAAISAPGRLLPVHPYCFQHRFPLTSCVSLCSLYVGSGLRRKAFHVAQPRNVLEPSGHSERGLSVRLQRSQQGPKDNNDEPGRWQNGFKYDSFLGETPGGRGGRMELVLYLHLRLRLCPPKPGCARSRLFARASRAHTQVLVA